MGESFADVLDKVIKERDEARESLRRLTEEHDKYKRWLKEENTEKHEAQCELANLRAAITRLPL